MYQQIIFHSIRFKNVDTIFDVLFLLLQTVLNVKVIKWIFSDKSPMINIPGFTFPVQEFLLEDILEIIR